MSQIFHRIFGAWIPLGEPSTPIDPVNGLGVAPLGTSALGGSL